MAWLSPLYFSLSEILQVFPLLGRYNRRDAFSMLSYEVILRLRRAMLTVPIAKTIENRKHL